MTPMAPMGPYGPLRPLRPLRAKSERGGGGAKKYTHLTFLFSFFTRASYTLTIVNPFWGFTIYLRPPQGGRCKPYGASAPPKVFNISPGPLRHRVYNPPPLAG